MGKHPVVLIVAVSLLMLACDRGGGEPTLGARSSVNEHPAVLDSEPATAQPALGGNAAPLLQVSPGSPSYLVDATGASVYFLQDNRDGSRCDADCEHAWPPVLSHGGSTQPITGVNASLLGSLPRDDGAHQVTYARQPLYRYAGDNGAGRTSGHEVRDKWGHWRLITPLGEALASLPAASSNTGATPPAQEGGTAAPDD